ncbi:anaerobic benzoate catabolism transcriptional regulator [Clostridium perfringens]|uniref:helix-turn-helix domain-containing protein n=1 Tax=Clostridium perfringens TaxID=1502 RepID=UPI0024443BBF|nr:helix-turn-helix transcriptional regulator [Clostridium perfringens]MDG6880450.1 anaerobic benzoate catabolism transcriptional regulator [Clostridium perfringens]
MTKASAKTTIIGNEIRTLRKDRGYTLEELANEIEITSGHISNIESGNRRPNYKLLEKLSDVLSFKVEDFLNEVTNKSLATANEVGQTMGFARNIKDEKNKIEFDKFFVKKEVADIETLILNMANEINFKIKKKDLKEIADLVDMTIRLRLEQLNK